MGYLRSQDYLSVIQSAELNQLTTNNSAVLRQAEAFAQGQMISHLTQRYDTDREFQPTTAWDPTKPYNAWDLIEINYPTYDATKTYPLSSLVIQSGVGYKCTTAITTPEAFNAAHWTPIGNQYDLYYALMPQEEFNYKKFYKVGDKVFWKNKVYTANQESVIPSHFNQLQYPSYDSIPYINIFPDDPVNGSSAWTPDPTSYSVPAGTLPTNTTYWTLGDNRDSITLKYYLYLTIYNATVRVSAQNVPNERRLRYEEAVSWLIEVSNGKLNCEIPERQPDQGTPVMWGGQVKRINQW
jgi:hypothetical protein